VGGRAVGSLGEIGARSAALAILAAAMMGGPALAQQEGLVNVNVGDVKALNDIGVLNGSSVQVPIGIAAQVCGVDANVIAQQGQGAPANCKVEQAQSTDSFINYVSSHNPSGSGGNNGGGGNGAGGKQEGLVNVNVGDVKALNDLNIANGTSVQVPVGIAAQVCGVDANVIAKQGQGAVPNCTVGQNQASDSFINYVKSHH
jgi:hypothetical protein